MSGADTIYALSSAAGRAGVAVVRTSGPLSRLSLSTLTGRACPPPRYAALRDLAHGTARIDRALVLWFPGPTSFTGEDMAEFHVHGGRAVILSLGVALQALGLRQAEPGEFSRRAFQNGKIDLTEAEAIADLIDAESASQQAVALAQADGALSRLYGDWSARLSRALAHVEASLDFADEDLPADMLESIATDVAALKSEIDEHLADARRGERLRQGVQIAILGAPNAGKSSLLNSLAQREIAIVSARAGTTRDVIEVHLDLGGYAVIVADTAGLRVSDDEIEGEGIARAVRRAADADIKLLLFDATAEPDAATLALRDEASVIVVNKADLANVSPLPEREWKGAHPVRDGKGEGVPFSQHPHPPVPSDGLPLPLRERQIHVSTFTGQGMPELLDRMTTMVADICGQTTRPPPTRERHASQLRIASSALRTYEQAEAIDLAAEELRIALSALGRLTGRVDIEDLLDIVFREFCIGK